MSGGKLAKLLNRERSLIDSYRPHSMKFSKYSAASATVRQVPQYIIELFAIGGVVVLTLILMKQNGGVGSTGMAAVLPVIGVFALAVYRMMPAFQKGYTAIVAIRLSTVAAVAIRDDLADISDLPELPTDLIEPMRLEKSIELRDVSYTYPGSATPSLKNINLTIPAGTSFGIVGQTGAGKTTLMDVIALRKNTGTIEGDVYVNGFRQDQKTFRRCSGYVEQFDVQSPQLTVRETVLFSGRLRLDANKVRSDQQKKKPAANWVLIFCVTGCVADRSLRTAACTAIRERFPRNNGPCSVARGLFWWMRPTVC